MRNARPFDAAGQASGNAAPATLVRFLDIARANAAAVLSPPIGPAVTGAEIAAVVAAAKSFAP